jgi:3-oxoacyl-[acyl-carrier protein] reductase
VGKVAVVTGAGRNLGSVIALALARDGFDVVVNTRSDIGSARAVCSRIEALGGRARAAVADVTDATAVARLMDEARELGDIRVLVNNAALRNRVPFGDLTLEQWRAALAVTLDAAFICSHAVLDRMSGGGRIVNILGANALAGDPDRVHVSAAKHGLAGLTRALAAACAGIGVTVNAVSPAGLQGEPDQLEQRRRQVADIVAFLCSQAASGITGQVIEVGVADAACERRSRPF